MGTDLTVMNRLRPMSIGFDALFEHFESIFNAPTMNNYPPHNIIKIDETRFRLEMAVAGFSKDEVGVVLQNQTLVISAKKHNQVDSDEVLHRGISQRAFERTFRLAENVEVVSADMADGMLTVNLEKIVPEDQKPRIIDIS